MALLQAHLQCVHADKSALTSLSPGVQHWTVDPTYEEAIHASSHIVLTEMAALGQKTCYSLQGPAFDYARIKEVRVCLPD